MPAPPPVRPSQAIAAAPSLAAAVPLFPNGLPSPLRVQVILSGDPNYGKRGTVDQYKDGVAFVRFGIFGKQVPYALDVLKATGYEYI